ncbi:hypothetical protein SPRG_14340 [Saprolegnia parasitica CBS 223.65]|uniref:Uncharacterized protein n=1 Tax=Saprolegnia parasitica (strain CBS 223.65) TaxID=695850 RepID=A0A067C1G5_SAPPC|nr:hypothetical protein SPRG_14340 [Saprolegnia parasitica CBS 223.65]KDO20401.1 hypothetical protein SPRG_14340 [Saprolegnia parasitica CBS 223.65]|eukprot:XP_012208858.1 hypothetical protein SPRG_14340 [Saprolegnia parasitica CBS 223.65]
MTEQPDPTADQGVVGSKEQVTRPWMMTIVGKVFSGSPRSTTLPKEHRSWQDVKADVQSIDEKLVVPNDFGTINNSRMTVPRGCFQATEEDDTSLLQ